MHSPRPRKTTNLSESVQHHLNMYALAARAAGVGVLALAQPAEAKIVYTAAHKRVDFRNPAAAIYIDPNHDGIKDFAVFGHQSGVPPFVYAKLFVRGLQPGAAILSTGAGDALALPRGARVSPKGTFGYNSLCMFVVSSSGSAFCPWRGFNTTAYLGLKFVIKGKTHFGWARLHVEIPHFESPKARAICTGYAYETIPNKPIIAGKEHDADNSVQPDTASGSLGRLALGRN